ncbi:MAG: hypothetical protein J2P49_09550 [Methylocapsa sp.]|nr:hypothetical protein [Methylocapsa sp.]
MAGASIAAAQLLREREAEPLELAVVLDEGLGSIAEILEEPLSIPFGELMGFPKAAAEAQEGQVVIGLAKESALSFFRTAVISIIGRA